MTADPDDPPPVPRLVATATAWVVIGGAALIIGATAGDSTGAFAGDFAGVLAALTAGWCCARASQRGGPDRPGWTVLALSMGSLAVAIVGTAASEIDHEGEPGPAVLASFVAFKLLAVLGLILFPLCSTTVIARSRARLEAAVVATSIAYIGWGLVLGPRFRDTPDKGAAAGIAVFAGIDLVLVALVLMIALRRPRALRRSWILLGTGLLLMVATDTRFSIELLSDIPSGVALNAGWLISLLFVALAAMVSRPEDKPRTTRAGPTSRITEAIPIAAAAGATLATLACYADWGRDLPLFILGMATAATLLAWQVTVLLENAELALLFEAEAHRFRTLVDSAPVAIVETDPLGVVKLWNPEAARLFGVAADQMIGTRPDVAPSDAPDAEGPVRRVLRGEVVHNDEMRLRRPDGETMDLLVSAAPLTTAGTVSGVVCLAFDDGPRQRAQAALVDADKLQALQQLAGGIAHDFNNLLAVILWTAESLLHDEVIADRHDALTEIIGASRGAADLISQLVTFTRRQLDQPEPLDINTVIVDLRLVLSRMCSGATVEFDLGAGLSSIVVDRASIEQALMNLVVNAKEATPAGGVVRVTTRRVRRDTESLPSTGVMPAGEYVEIAVSDEGAGIDPAVRPRIFEPFFSTKGRTGRGTGLGLSTVQGVILRAGGHIEVDTDAERGTTFRILIPSNKIPSGMQVTRPEAIQGTSSETDKVVLLVDDEPAVRRAASRILVSADYTVIEASSGEEAVSLLALCERAPDLLVSDVRMPGMTGLELAEQFQHSHPGRPVVLMSGFTADALDEGPHLGNLAQVLPKPFSRDTLLAVVTRALDAAASS